MVERIEQLGDSLAVRIPPAMAEDLGLTAESRVDLRVHRGSLEVVPVSGKRVTLEELLDQITPENLHPETDTGAPVGPEVV